MKSQLEAADAALIEQTGAACCYSRSDKYWVQDPSGIAWETFHSLGVVPVYGEDNPKTLERSCCIPLAKAANDQTDTCCIPAGSNARSACCK